MSGVDAVLAQGEALHATAPRGSWRMPLVALWQSADFTCSADLRRSASKLIMEFLKSID